jgi:signal transduction histidine kinase
VVVRVAVTSAPSAGTLTSSPASRRRGAYNGGPTTTIAVCDEGPGIPPEEAQRVFERFYRSDAARSTRDGGAGLGLAIARWIVDAHGGSIRAEERAPHGCRVVLDLPADRGGPRPAASAGDATPR